MASIKDIAQAAGVSLTTVSRVINNKEGTFPISQETREKVVGAIRNLGYKPNFSARRLRSKELDRGIGLYVPWGSGWDIGGISSFSAMVTEIVSRYIKDEHYSTALVFYSRGTIREHHTALSEVYGHWIAGMIIMGANHDDLVYLDSVHESMHPPFVVLHRNPAKASCVTVDNEGGAMALVVHLVGHGHRRIGIVTTPPTEASGIPNYVYSARLAGYRRALEESGIPWRPDLCASVESLDYPTIDRAVRSLLDAAEPPTAIVAARDVVVLGVYKSLAALGVSVPRDIAVVGFTESTELGGLLHPSVTRAVVDVEKMAFLAIEHLMACLRTRKDRPPLRETLPCELVIGESCGEHA
jgi:LacI family transcriptional regulator